MDEGTQDTATLLREQAEMPQQGSYNQDYQSLGHMFRQAREYHKLSIDDVAKKLCLTDGKIKAIEADDLQSFDAPIYARGYVETYAKLVGIPKTVWEPQLSKLGFRIAPKVNAAPAKSVKIDKSLATMSGSLLTRSQNKKNQKNLWIAAGILVVALVGVIWWSLSGGATDNTAASGAKTLPIQLKQGS